MLTGAFLYLPLVSMPEADSLKHPQSGNGANLLI